MPCGQDPSSLGVLLPICFAHPVEAQFARLLDFYGIPWEYEPHTFPLAYDDYGALKKAFRPDFYLPQSDTYVELTTMGQRQITRKHRKIKLLRERFPGIRLRLLNRRQLEVLLGRYGIALDAKEPSNDYATVVTARA